MNRYSDRRTRALAAAQDAELAGLLVAAGADLVYLVGHDPPPLERLTLLLLALGRDPVLVVPDLERPAAERAPGIDGVELVSWRDGDDPYELVARILRAGRYAVSDGTWASHLLALERATADCLFVAAGRALPLLRAVKDEDEIARLRSAAQGADATFARIVSLPFAGRREVDVAADLDRLLREHGHDRVEFTIVAGGPNGASPHHGAGERVVVPGEEELRVYEVVASAQQAAFEAVRPGVLCQDVDRAARAVITNAGYGERFIHRTGHGIGLEIHEPPYIVEGNETPLEPGMTFSDEPGVYLAGRFGVRIEDQVVVARDGAERLNQASREPTVVG